MKRIPLLLLLLFCMGCGSSIALFDQYAYAQVTSIKVDAADVMSMATDSYPAHDKEVRELTKEIRKLYEYDKNRPKNEKTMRQWDVLMNPNGHLLGGFLLEWQQKGKLDSVYVADKISRIGVGFDEIIWLETGKNKSSTNN